MKTIIREFKKAEIDELNGVFVLTETELEEVSGGRFLPGLVNIWHAFLNFLDTHNNTNSIITIPSDPNSPPPPPSGPAGFGYH